MKNDPAEWRRVWRAEDECSTGSATYPRDGRETIFDEYETFMPTTTVGAYLNAVDAAMPPGEAFPDPALPADFIHYLLQRAPTLFRLERFGADAAIDRFGRVYTSAADPTSDGSSD